MKIYHNPNPTLDHINFMRAPKDHVLARWRFWAMVDIAGKREQISAAIDAISDPMERSIARARADHATEYDPKDPLVQKLALAMGLSADELASLWAQAAQL